MMMTFEEFRGSAQWCDDLRIPLADSFCDTEIAPRGFIYVDALTIEKVGKHWPEKTRAAGRWYLQIGNMEWISDDLRKLEERLYEFAKDEGYCNDIMAAYLRYVRLLGLGFHVDTRGRDYVESDGSRTFTDAEAAEYDSVVEAVHGVADPYELAFGVWRGMGLMP